jgi:hypothetical protein
VSTKADQVAVAAFAPALGWHATSYLMAHYAKIPLVSLFPPSSVLK